MSTEDEALFAEVLQHLSDVSAIYRKAKFNIRSRPIIGGVFGSCRFDLCSLAYTSNKLDAITFLVMDTEAGFVLARGDTKESALGLARLILEKIPTVKIEVAINAYKARRDADKAADEKLRLSALDERIAKDKATQSATIRSIPRRRRQIFEASGGKCHYCSTALTLDGRWHIEHKMPKALGGDNAPGNLVASCAPCNHEKRDTTEQEYRAKRAAKAAA